MKTRFLGFQNNFFTQLLNQTEDRKFMPIVNQNKIGVGLCQFITYLAYSNPLAAQARTLSLPPYKAIVPFKISDNPFPTLLKEENLLLKQQLSKSMTSLISNGKVI